jgi:hypothetical protein
VYSQFDESEDATGSQFNEKQPKESRQEKEDEHSSSEVMSPSIKKMIMESKPYSDNHSFMS